MYILKYGLRGCDLADKLALCWLKICYRDGYFLDILSRQMRSDIDGSIYTVLCLETLKRLAT
ncbi:MAG: hypothetical protein OXG88_05665 [Gammaproteobacteria bacterium]|nr:hypothetical protein [Gammaproteobacteria bacterium]